MSELAPPRQLSWKWDVLLLVFEQADVPTLAVLGRVSLDILSATAPLLYKEVVVKKTRQLEQLFCERKENPKTLLPSRFNAFLSLSQVRSLTLDFAALPSLPTNLRVSSSRFNAPGPLPLDNLHIHYQDGCGVRLTLEALSSSLLPRLNPIHCTYHAFEVHSEGPDNSPWTWLGTSEVDLGWSRLTQLELIGLIPSTGQNEQVRLVGLSAPLSPALQIRVHAASMFPPCGGHHDDGPVHHWNSFLEDLELDTEGLGLESMQPGSLVLVAHSEKEKTELEVTIRLSRLTPNYRSLFSVKMEL